MTRWAGRPHVLLLLLLSLARTRGDALEDLRAKTNEAVMKAKKADTKNKGAAPKKYESQADALARANGMTPVPMPGTTAEAEEEEYVNPLPASALPKSAVPEGSKCGEIDHELSNTWENEGKPMFSFKVTINDWRPYKQVRVKFPHNVDDVRVFDATALETTRDSVKVELGLHTPRGSDFSIMGKGVHSMDLTVTCIPMAVPPPAPPHATDCELTKSYSIVNAWQTAEVARVTFMQWDPGRKMKLIYWGQEDLKVSNVNGGTLLGSENDGRGNYIVSIELAEDIGNVQQMIPEAPYQPYNGRRLGAPRSAEAAADGRDGVPSRHRLQDSELTGNEYYLELTLAPPPHNLPHIICHELNPPPPWLPPPSHPPPGPPPMAPPQPPVMVMVEGKCAAGGRAFISTRRRLEYESSDASDAAASDASNASSSRRALGRFRPPTTQMEQKRNKPATHKMAITIDLNAWAPTQVIVLHLTGLDMTVRPVEQGQGVFLLPDTSGLPPAMIDTFNLMLGQEGYSRPTEQFLYSFDVTVEWGDEVQHAPAIAAWTCREATPAELKANPNIHVSQPSPPPLLLPADSYAYGDDAYSRARPSAPPPPSPFLAGGGRGTGGVGTFSVVAVLVLMLYGAIYYHRNRALLDESIAASPAAQNVKRVVGAGCAPVWSPIHELCSKLGFCGPPSRYEQTSKLDLAFDNIELDSLSPKYDEGGAKFDGGERASKEESSNPASPLASPKAESQAGPFDDNGGDHDEEAQLAPGGRQGRHSKRRHGSSSSSSARVKWKVSVELEGEAFQISVPMSAGPTPAELKQAVAEVCLTNLGPDVTPVPWLEGHVESMAVQYLDPTSGAAMTMKPDTDIGDLKASRTLRVTRRGAKKPAGMAPPQASAYSAGEILGDDDML